MIRDSGPPDRKPTVHPPDRLNTLNEISRVLSATLDLQTLYETIYEQIGRVMDASQFFIGLDIPGRKMVEIPYMREEGNLFLNQSIPYRNNTTTLVITRGMTLLYNSAEEYHRYADAYGLRRGIVGEMDSESGIFVPLNTGSRTIGALTVQTGRRRAYTGDDLQTLTVIASQAAVAIENARLYKASQDNVRQMQALLHIARLINGSLDLRVVLNSILAGMRDVVPYKFGAIMLPNYGDGCLEIVGTKGPPECQAHMEHLRKDVKIPFGAGLSGIAFTAGEPLYVGDVSKHPAYIGHDSPEIQSEMVVPLKRGDTVIGVLDLERESKDAFSHDELDLLLLFASQAAIAIENARLFEEQEHRVLELAAIQTIVQRLTPLHAVSAITETVDEELCRLIDYQTCRIFSLHAPSGTLTYVNPPEATSTVNFNINQGFAGWIARTGTSLNIADTLQDVRGPYMFGTAERPESLIGAPLIYEERVQGVITLSKPGVGQFDGNALRLLEIVAAQAAIVLDRTRLYGELHTQAVTDDLTKLHNRRYLIQRFAEERSRAARNNHSLGSMMIDIDRFKRVNDRYGHDAGDVVLRELSRIIRALVRAEDVVVRYGGEEFCCLLPEVDIRDAHVMAERVRSVVERHRLPHAAGVSGISVSIGLAVLPADGELDKLFSLSDDAMYAAKRAGGNRVAMLSPCSV